MARLSLNKSELARQTAELAMYRRYLPALDLKRQQLMAARAAARAEIARLDAALAAHMDAVGAELPMLANRDDRVDGLVRLTGCRRAPATSPARRCRCWRMSRSRSRPTAT